MDRAELNFEQEVLAHFGYLIQEHGFHCRVRSASQVIFQSRDIFIEVFHGRIDYEIGIHFGKTITGKPFSFRFFLKHFFPAVDANLGECLADTPEKVHETTKLLSEAFQATGKNIMDGDDTTYKIMETVRWWDFAPDAPRRRS